jgi:hypothetical protein
MCFLLDMVTCSLHVLREVVGWLGGGNSLHVDCSSIEQRGIKAQINTYAAVKHCMFAKVVHWVLETRMTGFKSHVRHRPVTGPFVLFVWGL